MNDGRGAPVCDSSQDASGHLEVLDLQELLMAPGVHHIQDAGTVRCDESEHFDIMIAPSYAEVKQPESRSALRRTGSDRAFLSIQKTPTNSIPKVLGRALLLIY
jgi:hypothetical protein